LAETIDLEKEHFGKTMDMVSKPIRNGWFHNKQSDWLNWEDCQDSLDKTRRKWWHLQRCMHDWANKRKVEVRQINMRMARFVYPEIKS
jgi:hypothetical protein